MWPLPEPCLCESPGHQMCVHLDLQHFIKVSCMTQTETSNISLCLPNILLPPLPLRLPPGLYEGIRLADGQKGWFPVGNVIEITNEHVRRRNLRERYRVMRAASLVQKNNTIS